MPAISDLFSRFGDSAKPKVLFLGPSRFLGEDSMSRFRSLNIEHVSPAELLQQEISRRTPLGVVAERAAQQGRALPEETTLALMRRWFWTRKPDAGFALTGFPATLLQAKVFDEWLDARGEALDGVFADESISNEPLVDHYRTLGLLETSVLAA